MAEAIELFLDGRHNLRVIVSSIANSNSRGEIDVAIALDIPYFGVPGLVRIDIRLDADAPRDFCVPNGLQFFVRCHQFSPAFSYSYVAFYSIPKSELMTIVALNPAGPSIALLGQAETPELRYDARLICGDQNARKTAVLY
jgi:hypothetical protein